MNELIITSESDFAVMQKQASIMIKSGFLPQSIKTPEQAITIMIKGRELNIPYMEALSSINVILGKPTISPQLMLALARRTKELEDIKITEDDKGCEVIIKRKNQSSYRSFFGELEADDMGLSGKDNYKKQAQTMYKWRALAANLRVTFGDAICGLYLHEEINPDLHVDKEGKLLEDLKNVTPPKPKPSKKPEESPSAPTEKPNDQPTNESFKLLDYTILTQTKKDKNGKEVDGKWYLITFDSKIFFTDSDELFAHLNEAIINKLPCEITAIKTGDKYKIITAEMQIPGEEKKA